MADRDTGVIPLPDWFKEEVAHEKRLEQEEEWKELFRRFTWGWGNDEKRVDELLEKVKTKLEKVKDREDLPRDLIVTAERLVRFVHDFRRTRRAPGCWTFSYQHALSGLRYLVIEIDGIPDMIPGGLEDDEFILKYALNLVENEL